MSDVCVIVNPASGKGRGGGARAAEHVKRAFAAVGVTDIRSTTKKGDEMTVALRAIQDGVRTIVAVGGDGTWGNVANAILNTGAPVRLALAAAGTGNDFAKTVGVPANDFDAVARLAVDGPDVKIDVGRIENRYFLNVAGFGFDIAVLEDVETINWLGGNALYMYSALRQLFWYRGIPVTLSSPALTRDLRQYLMLIIANGRNFGGAFHIAPGASVTDGMLDAISIAAGVSPLRRLALFSAATKGTHVTKPEVTTEQAASFTLEFAVPPAFETDGEYNRASSTRVEVTCVPRALRVVTNGVRGGGAGA
jgi:diacylglycerol kinase (ATP)